MKDLGLEYVGSLDGERQGNDARGVLGILIEDKERFLGVIERLKESALVKPRDREELGLMGMAIAEREDTARLSRLGQEKPELAVLLIAYAMYEYF